MVYTFGRKEVTSMLAKNLKKYLDDHRIRYKTLTHPISYTAQEIAASAHIPGKDLAKTVIVKIDGKLAMIVEPAHIKLNLRAFKDFSKAKNVELAREFEFKDKFPECELGAMPPFGELYGMDVFVDKKLAADRDIAFNAGNHKDLIEMAWQDFNNLVHPRLFG
jgi:Ala-tRNA(Pro) deacylase